ncbi:hypothetical protein [Accumulibacter sp.]|uniref:hypothetical protein n=1 Tax=Accumulibacter sp. TaxID=2053492 RepID=UPI0035AF43A8
MKSIVDRASRRLMLACGLLVLALPVVRADVIPSGTTYVTGFGSGTATFVTDGTSNTIRFGEQTRVATCLDGVIGRDAPLGSIVDGSSNTIIFGPSMFLSLQVGQSLAYQPIGNIQDGTSNTIFIGENEPGRRCFSGETAIIDVGNAVVDGTSNTIEFGENSRFDVCFRQVSVGRIVDGTSNTLEFGEVMSSPVCFADVRVGTPAVATVAEGSTLGLLAIGLAALARRRRVRSGPL